VGRRHLKPKCCRRASPRRPRTRICLRKGCDRKYQPRRWNQRYCQDVDCLRQVRRWQAAQRQAQRRKDAAARTQHAQAERARRQRAKSLTQAPQTAPVAAARGHAAKSFFRCVCAPGRGAMNHPESRSVTRRVTAAQLAVRRCAGCSTANASGSGVALSEAAASVCRSTLRPAHGGADSKVTARQQRHHGRRRRDGRGEDHGPRRSAIMAWPAGVG
jgi:hypothetical protein